MFTKTFFTLAALAASAVAAPTPQDGSPVEIIPVPQPEVVTPAPRTFAFFAGFDAYAHNFPLASPELTLPWLQSSGCLQERQGY